MLIFKGALELESSCPRLLVSIGDPGFSAISKASPTDLSRLDISVQWYFCNKRSVMVLARQKCLTQFYETLQSDVCVELDNRNEVSTF